MEGDRQQAGGTGRAAGRPSAIDPTEGTSPRLGRPGKLPGAGPDRLAAAGEMWQVFGDATRLVTVEVVADEYNLLGFGCFDDG